MIFLQVLLTLLKKSHNAFPFRLHIAAYSLYLCFIPNFFFFFLMWARSFARGLHVLRYEEFVLKAISLPRRRKLSYFRSIKRRKCKYVELKNEFWLGKKTKDGRAPQTGVKLGPRGLVVGGEDGL